MDQICWQETNYVTNVWFLFQARSEKETKLQNCNGHFRIVHFSVKFDGLFGRSPHILQTSGIWPLLASTTYLHQGSQQNLK